MTFLDVDLFEKNYEHNTNYHQIPFYSEQMYHIEFIDDKCY